MPRTPRRPAPRRPAGARRRLRAAGARRRLRAVGATDRLGDTEARRVVERLAAGRAAAFRASSTAAATAVLAGVDEPGSAAHGTDAALVRRLAAARLRLDGLRFTVGAVRVERRDGSAVTVTARVATSAHRLVRADGTVVTTVPATAPRVVRLVVVRVGDGWRVRSAEPV